MKGKFIIEKRIVYPKALNFPEHWRHWDLWKSYETEAQCKQALAFLNAKELRRDLPLFEYRSKV